MLIRTLREDALQVMLVQAAKKGIYSFASPFHPRSRLLWDLMTYYKWDAEKIYADVFAISWGRASCVNYMLTECWSRFAHDCGVQR